VKVLIAPDKFKGTLDAPAVARAMAAGVRRACPDASITSLPLADGGEGTVAALVAVLGGRREEVRTSGPLGDPVGAELAHLDDGRAVLEMSSAAGMSLLSEERRAALAATSRGAGEVLRAALDAGARSIVVGVGGSASTDGGTGAAAAVGWRFLDGRGRPLPPGGASLRMLRHIAPDGVDARVRSCEVVGACDVGNPLLGEEGAARVFGPQKGASAEGVVILEEGLAVLAERIRVDLGVDVADRWGAGAGGGMGAGLIAFFGASLERGFELVAEAVGLRRRLEEADVVVTGEGRLDRQSGGGKVPTSVALAARRSGIPCLAIAGAILLPPEDLTAAGFAGAASLVAEVGEDRAHARPAWALEEVTARLLDETVCAHEQLA
jgi:glycerate kinase